MSDLDRLNFLDGLVTYTFTAQAEVVVFTNPSMIDPCAAQVYVSVPSGVAGSWCDVATESNAPAGKRYQLALSARNDATPRFILPPGGKLYATPSTASGSLLIMHST